MTLVGLAIGNLRRNKVRTGLTVLGMGAALFLYCFLESVLAGFSAGADVANASRLMTRNAVSLVQPLPIAYLEKIRAVPGVKDLTHQSWFGGTYEPDERLFFAQFAVEPESYLRVFSDYVTPPEQAKAFLADRKGCLLGARLARRIGKGPGDSVVITGTIYPGAWEFNVSGIFDGKDSAADEMRMLFHYDCLNEGRDAKVQGLVGVFPILLDDPARAADVSAAVDRLFENSPYATRTETERAFRLGFVQMLGNVALFLRAIGAAVVFTILLVSANTMVMAARERIPETGVLKTLGFSDRALFVLFLGEALALALLAGLVGCAGARLVQAPLSEALGSVLQDFQVPWGVMARGMLLALATGLVSGIAPARAAARLTVADALGKA